MFIHQITDVKHHQSTLNNKTVVSITGLVLLFVREKDKPNTTTKQTNVFFAQF